MTTIQLSLQQALSKLRQAGIPSAPLDARLLLQHSLHKPHEYIATHAETLLTEAQQAEYALLIDRRASREPVACIMGRKEFYGLDFRTSKDTLDPRPDTETLVEGIRHWALGIRGKPIPDPQCLMPSILDLGTGTGCILLTLLHLFPGASGVGVDRSAEALAVAQENAERLKLAERVRFIQGNWADGLEGSFDIIVSNPPYIPSAEIAGLEVEVRDYDPMAALDGGADGLECYRQLLTSITGRLKPGGLLALEIGQGQEHDVAALVEAQGYAVQELAKDMAGTIRCVFANSV